MEWSITIALVHVDHGRPLCLHMGMIRASLTPFYGRGTGRTHRHWLWHTSNLHPETSSKLEHTTFPLQQCDGGMPSTKSQDHLIAPQWQPPRCTTVGLSDCAISLVTDVRSKITTESLVIWGQAGDIPGYYRSAFRLTSTELFPSCTQKHVLYR